MQLYLVTFRYLTGRKRGQVSFGISPFNVPDCEGIKGRCVILPLSVVPIWV